jgi:glutamate-ammonia-ligase adenylyltransferase
VRGWHFGRFAAMRSTAAREALTEITPALLQAFSRAGNPDAALQAFDSLLKALPAGAQLFALLKNNRELLDLLATILGAAPRLAEIFGRRPHVVDALIDPAAVSDAMGHDALAGRLEASLSEASSYEDVLNRARVFAAEQRFLISVGLLKATLKPAEAGKAFSDLAEAVVRALFQRTRQEFERQHGNVPLGRATILAFGRLGSREMTAGSDLDLIVIYDHAVDATASDGARPLPPSQYYTRLTQRLTTALAAPTAEGCAYQVDLRLRPSGRAGPLATHIEAFEHYQLNEAWTWEHMAMSRGRPIAGDADLAERISAVLDRIVALPRDRDKLAAEIAAMRARIEREKPGTSAFDVKLASGGLIDCEFAAQHLVLAGLGRRPGETITEILDCAMRGARLAVADGEPLLAAAVVQTALLHIQRIADDRTFDPGQAPDALKRLLAAAADAALSGLRLEGLFLAGGHREPFSPAADFPGVERKLTRLQDGARRALERVLGLPIG